MNTLANKLVCWNCFHYVKCQQLPISIKANHVNDLHTVFDFQKKQWGRAKTQGLQGGEPPAHQLGGLGSAVSSPLGSMANSQVPNLSGHFSAQQIRTKVWYNTSPCSKSNTGHSASIAVIFYCCERVTGLIDGQRT